jgi:D-alanyl-D-alanine carboxypeptidase (penicillin-binding protein 5/6)
MANHRAYADMGVETKMKKCIAALLAVVICVSATAVSALEPPEAQALSAVLIEKETGHVLYEKNAREKLAPASVTKVMTMLLVMEAIEQGLISESDIVTVSAHAQSMGGSQVFIAEGEKYSVRDLLKGMIIASGNDASVALAEYVSGAESTFVSKMNAKAAKLGMTDTHFVNCCGLDADGHVTSARDIALMSVELMRRFPDVKNYTTVWQDSLRDGTFGLDNTNKLIRFYPGATGIKTGSTGKAKSCIAASAERDGVEFIAVIMAADNSDLRFQSARMLLDFGFANYTLTAVTPDGELPPVAVKLGRNTQVETSLNGNGRILAEKARLGEIKKEINLTPDVQAPVEKGQKLGVIKITLDNQILAQVDVVASHDVPRKTWLHFFVDLLRLTGMAA